MPEYLAPGVFVEEVSYRAKSIEGVGTSVAGLVGPTRTGPVRGKPELLTSFADYVRIYGDANDLLLSGGGILNHTAIAAKAFFDGGGTKLFVQRVIGTNALSATRSDAANRLTFGARFPGEQGNYMLQLHWRDSENLLKLEPVPAPVDGEVLFLDATGLTNAVRSPGIEAEAPDSHFPLGFRGLVKRDGDNYVIVDNLGVIQSSDAAGLSPTDLRPNGQAEGADGVLLAAGLVNGAGVAVNFTRVKLNKPQVGELANGTSVVITLNAASDLHEFTGVTHWGDLKVLHGTVNAGATEFTLNGAGLNPGINAPRTFNLAAFAAQPANAKALIQRNFDLDVHKVVKGKIDEVVFTYGNISTAHEGERSLKAVLSNEPIKRNDDLTSPIFATSTATNGDQILASLYSLFDPTALSASESSLEGVRYLIDLGAGTRGSDGDKPVAFQYGGEVNEVSGNTGFAAFEDVEDISIVMAPAAAADPANHLAIVVEMQKHVRKMRYRIGIVDSEDNWSVSEVRDFRSNFDDSRLALYYPWVVIADPTGARESISVPPAGFIAGVYANTDVLRGVHKAPANETVVGALRLSQEINRFQQELLNPEGINVLRSFPGRGHLVWGGRTLSSDPEWKYVNVRRYFLYLERSIEKSTQWVVFEPNGERLWANVRTTVEDFLYNEWFNGRLLGPTSKAAYFVRCDRSTITQNDLDNGRLVCEVGVAPLRPAEFVVFRVGQKTANA